MDNPNKKKADGKRISQQPHEQAYQKRKAAGKTGTAKKTAGKKKAWSHIITEKNAVRRGINSTTYYIMNFLFAL